MKALVCPLDWGLGHATRCVPIIRELLAQDCEVELGASGNQRAFFTQELPGLVVHEAPTYAIRYPERGWQMPFWLGANLPRIARVIREEQAWIEDLAKRRNATHIVSDNRFGCFSHHLPSVYVTHQLRIAFPPPAHWFESWGERWHRRQFSPFREVWIPDMPTAPGLAGKLSHPARLPAQARYVGPLSRFEASVAATAPRSVVGSRVAVLALLSGPEPQRSLFERKAFDALAEIPGLHVLVRGLPGQSETPVCSANLEIHNHLDTATLAQLLGDCQVVLCRPGYSTLMDLAVLGARPILVPTPGQTEQEYLARQLAHHGSAIHLDQNKLTTSSLKQAMLAPGLFPARNTDNSMLRKAIENLINLH